MLPITVFVPYISPLYSYLYCYAFKWQFAVITLRGLHNVLVFRHFLEIWFLGIWQVYENYSRKTTKDRDLTCSPVVATCVFCQTRWFVIMWLHIEPLQPISNKKCCVVLGEKARTGHIISQYSYTSDILVLNCLIW